jgi:hypothetical protein
MVPVSATPYACASSLEEPKVSTAATTMTSRNQLMAGM